MPLEPFSITAGAIGLLSNLYNVYTAVRQASRDWTDADLRLSMLDIRMKVASAVANHNLRELESSYSDGEAALSAEAKEIRAKCATILETLLRRCETKMVSLEERVGLSMTAIQRMDWITSLKKVSEECTTDLQKWNEETERVLQLGTRWAYPPTPSSSREGASPRTDALWLETLARMTVARDTPVTSKAQSDSLWINPEELDFEEETASTRRPLFARVKLGFSQQPKLKLRPRRFGYRVREGREKEPIMVEFREYYQNLSAERPGEYKAMRSGIMQLAHMLHCANSNNKNEDTESVLFPSVPLIGFSELSKSTPPCFLLVYNWSEMKSLFQIIAETSNQKPPAADRLKLASDLGKSLFAFHTTGYVHGLLNPDNIFLSSSNFQATRPLLAGFDISRSTANNTNKLDVKDLDARLYLHPDRLDRGQEKDANYPPYDVYSLGIIWLEIGLWLPLRKLKGMGRETLDRKRRDRIFEACQSRDMKEEMGAAYVKAIEYCLQGVLSPGPTPKSPASARVISAFDEANASEAVALLPTKLPIPTSEI